MSRSSVRLIGIAMLLVAAAVAWVPLNRFLAVDSCLDGGGSFDYSNGICDFEQNHPDAPRSTSPLLLVLGVVSAIGGAFLLVFSRRIASEPGMRSNKSLERTRGQ
jgi:hypothetical protein